jgi:hypothetical protein
VGLKNGNICAFIAGRLNIVKMAIHQNVICIFNEIPMKITMTFLAGMEKSIQKFL